MTNLEKVKMELRQFTYVEKELKNLVEKNSLFDKETGKLDKDFFEAATILADIEKRRTEDKITLGTIRLAASILDYLKKKVKSKYEKGSFGYWWTIIQGKRDIRGEKLSRVGIDCSGAGLTSLYGSPIKIDYFDCSNNNLKTLEFCPRLIKFDFRCDNNQLINFQHLPIKFGNFYCNNIYQSKND